MKQITAKEFYAMIEKDPAVFEHWETPLEITEPIHCYKSPITHLSPHLTFSGISIGPGKVCASFLDCQNLTNASGTFHGYVDFSRSNIVTIKELTVTKIEKEQWSANFNGCKALETATGTFQNFVDFSETGIQRIQNLHIQLPWKDGKYASFSECPNLNNLNGWDLDKSIWIEDEKLAAEKKRRAALQKFHKKTQAEELPFL
jgi:hypothetical protein